MTRFLMAYLSIFSMLNLFVWLRLRSLGLIGKGIWAGLVLILLTLTPFATKFSWIPKWVDSVGRVWIGMALLLFFCFVITELAGFILGVPSKTRGCIGLVLGVLLCGWGLFESWHITPTHYTVEIAGLPRSWDGMKVAHVTDTHFGPTGGIMRMDRLVHVLKEEKPDIILMTGDWLDGHLYRPGPLIKKFSEYKPPLGTYASLGNHEYIEGLGYSGDMFEAFGMKLLRNDWADVNGLYIIGIDDMAGDDFDKFYSGGRPQEKMSEVKKVLSHKNYSRTMGRERADEIVDIVSKGPSIVMYHRPDVLNLGFSLQLSGHSHDGQIYPFIHIVKRTYPYTSGLHELSGGRQLIVGRGAGTWGPPLRFLTPPEVGIITLKAK